MGFLIGAILVYHYDLHWSWYLVCGFMYAAEWTKHHEYYRKLHLEILELRARVSPPVDEHDD